MSIKIIFVNEQKTKVLIAGYNDGGYGLVGGHLNTGENIIAAVVREALEETGLVLN